MSYVGAIDAELYGEHSVLLAVDGLTLRRARGRLETHYEIECWSMAGLAHLHRALALIPVTATYRPPEVADDDPDLDPEEMGVCVLHFWEVNHAHTDRDSPIRKPAH